MWICEYIILHFQVGCAKTGCGCCWPTCNWTSYTEHTGVDWSMAHMLGRITCRLKGWLSCHAWQVELHGLSGILSSGCYVFLVRFGPIHVGLWLNMYVVANEPNLIYFFICISNVCFIISVFSFSCAEKNKHVCGGQAITTKTLHVLFTGEG